MARTVNLAVQFLPLHLPQAEAYRIIDAAIAVVQASGLEHVVSPFETVLEGPYDEVMAVFNAMQQAAFRAGAGELLINSKLHRSASRSLRLTDKTGKYGG